MKSLQPARAFLILSAFLTLAHFSGSPGTSGRGLASCAPVIPVANFPVPWNLVSQIQDTATQGRALDFYYYLTQVELTALQGRQAIFGQYSAATLSSGAPAALYRQPTVAAFPFQAAPVTNGSGVGFWGALTLPGTSLAQPTTALPTPAAPAPSSPVVAAVVAPGSTIVIQSSGQKPPASTVLPLTSNAPGTFIVHGSK